jgi:hypothetical protein
MTNNNNDNDNNNNNKQAPLKWDVSQEKLYRLIQGCVDNFKSGRPMTQLQALEFELALWHPSRGKDRGIGYSGQCSYTIRNRDTICDECFLSEYVFGVGFRCMRGMYDKWKYSILTPNIKNDIAEQIYQFILTKYLEQKEIERTSCADVMI